MSQAQLTAALTARLRVTAAEQLRRPDSSHRVSELGLTGPLEAPDLALWTRLFETRSSFQLSVGMSVLTGITNAFKMQNVLMQPG